MDFFSHTLPWRLALAFLSGLSMWLLMLFPELEVGEYWNIDFVFAPVGFLLGLLVLAPFISGKSFRIFRAIALIFAALMIQTLVVWLTLGMLDLDLQYSVVIINVLLGTVLICIATGLLAPIKINLRYITYAVGAGLLSGLSFYIIIFHLVNWFCFKQCFWWYDLDFVGG